MTSIKINNANDVVIENNDLVLINGRDEIAQVLMQKLRLFRGEWFLDTADGVPYYEEILKKNPEPTTVDALFKNEILSTPGVIELLDFSLDITDRRLTLDFAVRTENGIINFNEETI